MDFLFFVLEASISIRFEKKNCQLKVMSKVMSKAWGLMRACFAARKD